MLTTPYLEILSAVAGILVGTIIVYGGPRLAAYRFEKPPELPPRTVLIPLAGGFVSRWEPLLTLLVQLVTGAVLAGLAVRYSHGVQLPLADLYSCILIAIAYIDMKYRLVLNRLSYPAIVLALAGGTWWPSMGILSSLEGLGSALLLFGALELLGRGALGTGDTKLAMAIGAMRGFPAIFDALLIGMLLGGLAAVFLWVVLRRSRKEKFAYAPYLAAGAVISLFMTTA